MIVSIISAINGPMMVIGKDGRIPWRCSEDMRRFKELTTGFPVIMGRITFESLGLSDGLTDRVNIVVSRQGQFEHGPCVTVVNSVAQAVDRCRGMDVNECFVIGGASIYREALSLDEVDRIYLTVIHGEYDGDTFFPAIDFNDWSRMSSEDTPDATYMILGRKSVADRLGNRRTDISINVAPEEMSVSDLETEMNGTLVTHTENVSVVASDYAADVSVLADIVQGDPEHIDDEININADVGIDTAGECRLVDMAQVMLHLIEDMSYLVDQAELEGSEARAVQNSIMLISSMLTKNGVAISRNRSDINSMLLSGAESAGEMGEIKQNAISLADCIIKMKKTVRRVACGLVVSSLVAVSSLVLLLLLM